MKHFEWNFTQEGIKLYGQGWSPEFPKAVIVLIHGFGEHSTRFAHVARFFCEHNIAFLAYDQFGHGKTEGKRGYAPSYEASLDSVDRMLEEAAARFPGIPQFLYGHSMGGNVMLNYILKRKSKIKGAIASSPWLRLGFEPPAFKLFLAKFMKNIFPAFPENAALDTSAISRDKEEVKKYINDPLIHGTVRAGTFFETFNAGKWALEHADELKVPLLLQHGTGDKIIAYSGSQDFAAKAPKQYLLFKSYEGFYHELHNEPERDRQDVFNYMLTWIQQQLA